jgi:hypothetical protein
MERGENACFSFRARSSTNDKMSLKPTVKGVDFDGDGKPDVYVISV